MFAGSDPLVNIIGTTPVLVTYPGSTFMRSAYAVPPSNDQVAREYVDHCGVTDGVTVELAVPAGDIVLVPDVLAEDVAEAVGTDVCVGDTSGASDCAGVPVFAGVTDGDAVGVGEPEGLTVAADVTDEEPVEVTAAVAVPVDVTVLAGVAAAPSPVMTIESRTTAPDATPSAVDSGASLMQRDGELSAPDPSGVHVNTVLVPVTVPVTPGAGR